MLSVLMALGSALGWEITLMYPVNPGTIAGGACLPVSPQKWQGCSGLLGVLLGGLFRLLVPAAVVAAEVENTLCTKTDGSALWVLKPLDSP